MKTLIYAKTYEREPGEHIFEETRCGEAAGYFHSKEDAREHFGIPEGKDEYVKDGPCGEVKYKLCTLETMLPGKYRINESVKA